jgi:hypothetical protein
MSLSLSHILPNAGTHITCRSLLPQERFDAMQATPLSLFTLHGTVPCSLQLSMDHELN